MSEKTDRLIPREGTDPYGWRISDQELASLTERVFGVKINASGTVTGENNGVANLGQNGIKESGPDLGGKVLRGVDLGRKDTRLGRSF